MNKEKVVLSPGETGLAITCPSCNAKAQDVLLHSEATQRVGLDQKGWLSVYGEVDETITVKCVFCLREICVGIPEVIRDRRSYPQAVRRLGVE